MIEYDIILVIVIVIGCIGELIECIFIIGLIRVGTSAPSLVNKNWVAKYIQI